MFTVRASKYLLSFEFEKKLISNTMSTFYSFLDQTFSTPNFCAAGSASSDSIDPTA